MARRKLTEEDHEEIRQLTRARKTRQEIHEITGWSIRSIDRSREYTQTPSEAPPPKNERPKKYDREQLVRLFERNAPNHVITSEMNMPISALWRIRSEMGYAKPNALKSLPPRAERLREAERLVEEGASFAEITRSTHIHPPQLRKLFPGKQWTQEQATELAVAVRQANRKMRKSRLDIHSAGL